jgi:uncharacterized membrane protein
MGLLEVALVLATFLSSIVAGFLFAFSVVVMAGIKKLDNRGFIRAFQAMDGIIQNNQPIFVLVWIGSVLALIVAAALGVGHLEVTERWLLIASTVAYLVGVQLPTFTINIPLNNRLQSLKVDAMDESAQQTAREAFEGRWNRWNAIRTVVSGLVSLLLIVLVLRI